MSGLTGSRSAVKVDLFTLTPSVQGSFHGVRRYASKPKLSQDAIQERVLDVCKKFDKLTNTKVSLESSFMGDLGMDSLDQVELVMAFEDEFGFEISDKDGEKLLRPADVVKFVLEKQAAVPGGVID